MGKEQKKKKKNEEEGGGGPPDRRFKNLTDRRLNRSNTVDEAGPTWWIHLNRDLGLVVYELHFSSQRIEYCVYSISLISNLRKTFSFLSFNLKMK